jgi:outer membrane protein
MIRPACLRAFALVPLACWGLVGASANAEQSEPASPVRQADPKNAPDRSPGLPMPGDPKSLPAAPQAQSIPIGSSGPAQTPAQQRYGLPRNPIIGGPVDTDLTRPLTLERAIQIGLQRQNSIAIAQAATDSASARVTQARSSYYPQVTPSYQFQTNLSPGGTANFGGQLISTSRKSETHTEVVVARQLIFDSGIREANVGLSRRNLFASEYNLGNERQNVVLQVTQNYYTLLRDRALVSVEEESVKRAQTTLEAIKAQVEAGTAAKSDTYQAESDLANAKVALLQAQNDYNVEQAALKNAMGVVTSQPILFPDNPVEPPNTTPDPVGLEHYVQTAYRNRLDIKQAQERIHAQGYSVRIAKINSGVTLDANVTEGYALDPTVGEERTFTVSLSYPLFDGGNTRAAVRDTRAVLEQDRRTLDQLQQTVRLNVEQSYLIREQAKQRLLAAAAAVAAGQTNYNAALEKQRNGLINILDVINAEVQLVNAQVAQVQAIYDFYIADATLRRDVGLNDPVYIPRVPNAKPPTPVGP